MPGTDGLNHQQLERFMELVRWVASKGPGTVARRILDLETEQSRYLQDNREPEVGAPVQVES